MNNFYKNFQNEKVTLCSKNNCVTVYGETAMVINTLAVVATTVILIALVANSFR